MPAQCVTFEGVQERLQADLEVVAQGLQRIQRFNPCLPSSQDCMIANSFSDVPASLEFPLTKDGNSKYYAR